MKIISNGKQGTGIDILINSLINCLTYMIEQMPKSAAFRNTLALMKEFHCELLWALFGPAHH